MCQLAADRETVMVIPELVGITLRLVLGPSMTQIGVNEPLKVTVQDTLHVSHFVVCSQVFDHLVGLEDIAPHLTTPGSLTFFAPDLIEVSLTLQSGTLGETRLEHCHGPRLVLELRPLILALHDDPRGKVGDPHSTVGGVDMLTAGTLGTVGVDP